MTQQQLADQLGVKHQQVNKYVNNKQGMSYEAAKNISVVLGCDMSELYDWKLK